MKPENLFVSGDSLDELGFTFGLQRFNGEGGDGGDEGDGSGGDDGEGGDDGKGDGGDDKTTVPYNRFKKVNDRKKLLETENGTLKTQLTDAQNQAKGKEEADASLRKEKDDEVKSHSTTKEQLKRARLENAFIIESAKAGVNWADLDDAMRLADFSEVEIGDEGVDRDDMSALVKGLAKKKPHLLKSIDGGPNFPNGKPPKRGGEKTPEQLAQERALERANRRNGVSSSAGGANPWATK
jgi:hypothetical protein